MDENSILIKSEKISQKKKVKIAWITVAVLFLVMLISFIIDYSGYKKGQEFALASSAVASELSGSRWFSQSDSYAEKCQKAYRELDRHSYDVTLNGIKYDASDVRKSESALRSAFYDVMKKAGYDRYGSYSIANWFKYTNPIQYYAGEYALKFIPIIFYIGIVVSGIITIIVVMESKKEMIVYEDFVVCKKNSKKSKQLVFGDINSIDVGKNTLKLVGAGIKYKISNITNADEINSILISKKNASTSTKAEQINPSNADELKKYKDLLDQGIISQDEFDAKKKQLLGL